MDLEDAFERQTNGPRSSPKTGPGAQKNPLFQQPQPKVDLEIGSLRKITGSENPAGIPRILLES